MAGKVPFPGVPPQRCHIYLLQVTPALGCVTSLSLGAARGSARAQGRIHRHLQSSFSSLLSPVPHSRAACAMSEGLSAQIPGWEEAACVYKENLVFTVDYTFTL